MVYPLWYLVALVGFWVAVPPTLFVLYDWLRTGKIRLRPKHRQWYWAYVFLSAALAWATLFMFFPLAHAIRQSLTNFSLTSAAATRWVGVSNYTEILTDPFWWRTLLVTFLFAVGTVPVTVLISMFLAVRILRQTSHLQTFFKAALYLPGVIGFVVSAAILKWIFHSGDGFANGILEALGLQSQNWFGDPNLAMPVLIAMVWLTANGVGVIIYCAAIGNIPRTYYEAGELDGASSWTAFFSITWPLAKPTTIYVTVIGLIGAFQVFAPAMLITAGGPLKTTYFVNYHIYRTFYYDNNFGLASAMSVLLMLIIVVVSILNYRWLATDVEY